MSNMNPQIQNGFNGGIWASLEGKVQSWGKITNDQDTLYVAKGGTIDNNNIIKYLKTNNTIPVPKYFYMAILSLKKWSGTGIVLFVLRYLIILLLSIVPPFAT